MLFEKFLVSRMFVSTRQMSETWRTKSDMDGHLSGGANKQRIQSFSNSILCQSLPYGEKIWKKL